MPEPLNSEHAEAYQGPSKRPSHRHANQVADIFTQWRGILFWRTAEQPGLLAAALRRTCVPHGIGGVRGRARKNIVIWPRPSQETARKTAREISQSHDAAQRYVERRRTKDG